MKDNIGQRLMVTLEEDITKEEVECVLSHLADYKILRCDRSINEFLNIQDLKGPLP